MTVRAFEQLLERYGFHAVIFKPKDALWQVVLSKRGETTVTGTGSSMLQAINHAIDQVEENAS